ncbi:MAG: hypothetical protein ABIP03_00735 [Aquihabitans sp.]
MIQLDPKSLYELAQRHSPVLRFHEQERFYPVLAESWLTHVSEAPWTTDPAHHMGDLKPDPHRRGTALFEANRWVRDATKNSIGVLAGQPVGADRPIQFSTDPSDPYAIGRPALAHVDGHTFLGLAGWLDDDRRSGDLDRLYALFSELAAAINPANAWSPLAGQGDLPHAWVRQPVSTTTYCEARWARDFPDVNDGAELRDFPDNDGVLNGYLALTYHYLYPAQEPGLDGVGYHLEGQWEAITLFFRGEGGRDGGVVAEEPDRIVVSQGTDQAGNHHRTAHKAWGDPGVEKLGHHPVLYVTRGTHRFVFAPVSGETSDGPGSTGTGGMPPGSDPGSHDDDRHEGAINDLLILGLILLALAALATVVGAIVMALVLLALALWALFEWLASLFDSGDNDDSGDPIPASEGNDEATQNGTQVGGDEDPAPGAAPGSAGPTGGGGFGVPNSGSPTGRATTSCDVRVIDRVFQHGEDVTGYPSERPLESPTWWDYSGGWGVRVVDGFGTGWRHGTRRIDELGRSWSYWNSLRLSTVLHGGNESG